MGCTEAYTRSELDHSDSFTSLPNVRKHAGIHLLEELLSWNYFMHACHHFLPLFMRKARSQPRQKLLHEIHRYAAHELPN